MNTDLINRAIAEACGWTDNGAGVFRHPSNPHDIRRVRAVESSDCGRDQGCKALPNYHADLNAMHDAEKTLGDKRMIFWDGWFYNTERAWFLQVLFNVIDPPDGGIGCNCFADAAQRAEAFLRVKGLWTAKMEVKP